MAPNSVLPSESKVETTEVVEGENVEVKPAPKARKPRAKKTDSTVVEEEKGDKGEE